VSAKASMRRTLPEYSPSTPVNSDDSVLTQLDLFVGGRGGRLDDRWAALRKEVRAAADELDPKQVAYDLDVSPSQLSHALAERDRHIPMKWIIYFVERSRHGAKIAAYLAALSGHELTPRRELTPEERLERIERAIAEELGPGVRRAVLERAFGGAR
jgi:hypothetical protein